MAHPITREKDMLRAPPGRMGGRTLTMPAPHDTTAIAKPAPPDISLEQRELDLLGPVYVLDKTDSPRGYARNRVNGVEELRRVYLQGVDERVRERRTFVFQGLPAEYVPVLRDELDVDVRFLEAHVGKRAYAPLMRRGVRRAGDRDDGTERKASFACFEYPELLTSRKGMVTAGMRHGSLDRPGTRTSGGVAGETSTHLISNDEEYSVFCRASLWLGSKADVLLLDRPEWTRPSSEFRKAVYSSPELVHSPLNLNPVTGNASGSSVDSDTLHNKCIEGAEIPSFETLLYQSLVDQISIEQIPSSNDKATLIEDIAIHQWTEFFEALSTDLTPGSVGTTVLYKQIQRSLERNLSQSKIYNEPPSATPTWESLLSRLNRHITFLTSLSPHQTPFQPPAPLSPSSSASNRRAQLTPTALPPPTSHRAPPTSPTSSDQNQQSLDRVSYMGGVLLPLSIVSSILSMSDPFNPGGSQFFVFWAVSVPLVFLTILIIYADSIRKAEVWIEVASTAGAGAEEDEEEEKKEEERKEGVARPEFVDEGALRRRRKVASTSLSLPVNEMAEYESDDGYGYGEWDEPPGMMVERMFKNSGKKRWRKEQLGWVGACKAVFRIYKLKKGRPPSWQTNVRRGNTV
ncbi:hypothetical protein F5B19DRAFT_133580 [Rostrohypoxylon terebratum]|nr:hypothetical protein F5B19DRAFT_133580 [Rostrohypoxylon terebratum]